MLRKTMFPDNEVCCLCIRFRHLRKASTEERPSESASKSYHSVRLCLCSIYLTIAV